MTILLFARYPRVGLVKTRLSTTLAPDDTLRLYRAFLLDAVESALSIHPSVVPQVLVADRADVSPMKHLLADEGFVGVEVSAQSAGDLGVRLNNAFATAFDGGAGSVCAVGTDHPTLPAEYLRQAFRALDRTDVALGPADDGGYYLIAARYPVPRLLLDMPYSTSDLALQVRRRAVAAGISLTELPPWYDVDDAHGLENLARDLSLAGARTREVFCALRLVGGRQ